MIHSLIRYLVNYIKSYFSLLLILSLFHDIKKCFGYASLSYFNIHYSVRKGHKTLSQDAHKLNRNHFHFLEFVQKLRQSNLTITLHYIMTKCFILKTILYTLLKEKGQRESNGYFVSFAYCLNLFSNFLKIVVSESTCHS